MYSVSIYCKRIIEVYTMELIKRTTDSKKPPNGFHCLKSLVDIECPKVTCSVVLHVKTRCVSSAPWLTIFWEYHAISTDDTNTLLDDISSQLSNKYYLQDKI